MLTARGRPEDVLSGFAAGADDYLPKPFDLSILLARLNGLLRRLKWHQPADESPAAASEDLSSFEFAGRRIDFEALELTTLGRTVRLTLMEADLLRYLVRNQGRIISRKEILERVWRVREDTDTRAIDNFIVRLRRYIEDEPSEPGISRPSAASVTASSRLETEPCAFPCSLLLHRFLPRRIDKIDGYKRERYHPDHRRHALRSLRPPRHPGASARPWHDRRRSPHRRGASSVRRPRLTRSRSCQSWISGAR